MKTLASILDAPGVAGRLELVHGTAALGRRVETVAIVDALEALGAVPRGALVLVAPRASAEASSYRLDVALANVGGQGAVAATLLADGPVALLRSTQELADRFGIALLRARAGDDLAALAIDLSREIEGGADAAVARGRAALAALDRLGERPAPDDAIEAAAQALGGAIARGAFGAPPPARAVVVDGVAEDRLALTPSGEPARDVVADLVLAVVAAVAGRAEEAARRTAVAPLEAASAVLSELLVCGPEREQGLVDDARAAGVPVDGWHLALAIALDATPADAADASEALAYARWVADVAVDTARGTGGGWRRARTAGTTLLLRSDVTDPGAQSVARAVEIADRIVRNVRRRDSRVTVRAGVGTPGRGLPGLRRSSAEARAALLARDGDVAPPVASFDALGDRRALYAWYASPAARETADRLLAPLAALTPRRRAEALETLAAFLDNQGSLARTGSALHLHRNAVAYRMRRLFELLGTDPEDVEARLLLHLAVRARRAALAPDAGR